jgi:hypothetical protein
MTDSPRVRVHQLYGSIPLVERVITGQDGESYPYLEPDPEFRPELPPGAIRGDPSRQSYCSVLHTPKYFYLDEDRECVDCGEAFVFEAKEQRYWYETLQFNLNSVAVRCPRCRGRRRRTAEYGRQVGLAREAVAADPQDPAPYLDLAEGLVRQHQASGAGGLDEAVWASRRAGRLWPGGGGDPEFWEGVAHWLSGRPATAEPLLRRFLSHPASIRRRYRPMVKEAQDLLRLCG